MSAIESTAPLFYRFISKVLIHSYIQIQRLYSLDDIYCYGSIPVYIDNSSEAFSLTTYSNCTLHVPYGTIDRYQTADGWKNFANIVEFDPTGIEAVSADRKPATEQRIYNLGGVRMVAPQRGLNFINGKKVVY